LNLEFPFVELPIIRNKTEAPLTSGLAEGMKFTNPKFPRLISVQYKEHVLEVGKLLLVTNTGVDRWPESVYCPYIK